MLTDNRTYTTYDNGWILRIRPSSLPKPAKMLLLIHGWTGDENSMWVFARQIPDDYAIIAPRGPINGPSGFGWASLDAGQDPADSNFTEIGPRLLAQTEAWMAAQKMDPSTPIDLMGFSQGTALSYSLLANHTGRIGKVAGLSGFMTSTVQKQLEPGSLSGKEVFVAHGSQDDIIPIERARTTVEALEKAGARVHYCEEGVGHKLGAACFKGLKEFFV